MAAPPALHLTRAGLVATPPARQERVQAPLEDAVVFDHRLTRPLVLPEVRTLVLHVRFPTRQGNAKIAVRLLDCAATAAGDCTELSLGGATQDKASTTEFTAYEMRLLRSGTSASTLAAGRVLRLEVVVREPGAKAPAVLALGSAATPSRLLLSAA